MLTRDLLRYNTTRNGRIFPRFLDVQSQLLLNLAQELTALYESGDGASREELAELATPIINGHRSILIAKGLNKLLLDRCAFQEPDGELEALRMAVFETAAGCMREPGMNSLQTFRQTVGQAMTSEPDALAAALHADLPVRQPLLGFRPISPVNLLHRYNMAQAQGPLLWADRLTVWIREPQLGRRRQFFRQLKFFRLLAQVAPDGPGGFRIDLDGPLSLFDSTRKYGLQLASFLPAVCVLENWRIQARVRIGGDDAADLELDQTSGLKSHITRTSAFVPDSHDRFAEQFQETAPDWKIQAATPLLDLGGQELAVPDFSFRHTGGQVVHLELFHRWHAAALLRRLPRLDGSGKKPALALGVDRFLGRQPEVAAHLENSPWYRDHGFPFNTFPPVKRVIQCLDGFLPD